MVTRLCIFIFYKEPIDKDTSRRLKYLTNFKNHASNLEVGSRLHSFAAKLALRVYRDAYAGAGGAAAFSFLFRGGQEGKNCPLQ